MQGRVIGGYQIQTSLGHGCFGEAYKAVRVADQSPYVVKFPPRADYVYLLKGSFRTRINVSHPQIIGFEAADIDTPTQLPWVAFPFVSNRSLAKIMGKKGALDHNTALLTIRVILNILGHIQESHLAHGCLTPTNVIFGAKGKATFTDFGLSELVRTIDQNAFLQHIYREPSPGLPAPYRFLAPSRLQGAACRPEHDLFSVGILFYYLLTGETELNRPLGDRLHPQVPAPTARFILALTDEAGAIKTAAQALELEKSIHGSPSAAMPVASAPAAPAAKPVAPAETKAAPPAPKAATPAPVVLPWEKPKPEAQPAAAWPTPPAWGEAPPAWGAPVNEAAAVAAEPAEEAPPSAGWPLPPGQDWGSAWGEAASAEVSEPAAPGAPFADWGTGGVPSWDNVASDTAEEAPSAPPAWGAPSEEAPEPEWAAPEWGGSASSPPPWGQFDSAAVSEGPPAWGGPEAGEDAQAGVAWGQPTEDDWAPDSWSPPASDAALASWDAPGQDSPPPPPWGMPAEEPKAPAAPGKKAEAAPVAPKAGPPSVAPAKAADAPRAPLWGNSDPFSVSGSPSTPSSAASPWEQPAAPPRSPWEAEPASAGWETPEAPPSDAGFPSWEAEPAGSPWGAAPPPSWGSDAGAPPAWEAPAAPGAWESDGPPAWDQNPAGAPPWGAPAGAPPAWDSDPGASPPSWDAAPAEAPPAWDSGPPPSPWGSEPAGDWGSPPPPPWGGSGTSDEWSPPPPGEAPPAWGEDGFPPPPSWDDEAGPPAAPGWDDDSPPPPIWGSGPSAPPGGFAPPPPPSPPPWGAPPGPPKRGGMAQGDSPAGFPEGGELEQGEIVFRRQAPPPTSSSPFDNVSFFPETAAKSEPAPLDPAEALALMKARKSADPSYGLVVSGVEAGNKRNRAAVIIAKLLGIPEAKAQAMCTQPVIPVLNRVERKVAEDALKLFEAENISARVTARNS